jgi:predicted dehydrogenase
MSKVRVGLIGANWGRNHILAWKSVPDAEIVAICTSREETARAVAAEFGIERPMWDASALISDPDIDIVDITVRPPIRAPLALEALAAGKSILQTIPFALDLDQARRLEQMATAGGPIGMLESLHRHAPAFRQAKAMLDAGAIGRVQSVRGHVRTGILLSPPADWVYEWIIDPSNRASALRNFGAHLLHQLVWYFGRIESVAATLSTQVPQIQFADGSARPNAVVDTAALLVRFESGADGAVDASWVTPGSEGFSIDAIGETGRLRISADFLGPQNARIEHAQKGSRTTPILPVPLDEQYLVLDGAPGIRENPDDPNFFPIAAMCHRLARAVRGIEVGDAGPDFAEALHVMQVVETAYHAHRERRWVEVRG